VAVSINSAHPFSGKSHFRHAPSLCGVGTLDTENAT
jgi:hypothetical protein